MKPAYKSLIALAALILLVYNPITVRLQCRQAAQRWGLDADLFEKQIKAESHFWAFAYNRSGAIGPGQIRPQTASWIYPRYRPGILWLPYYNMDIAARYMRYLLNKYNGNNVLALAAYNWGEGNVDNRLKQSPVPQQNQHKLFEDVRETFNYLKKILSD